MDNQWKGNQIAILRKRKGYTGEKFSELIGVTPQAVSKWENGKCLPETALLPRLSEVLEVTIDQLLIEKELTIIKAIFTDGKNSVDITKTLNHFIIGNRLKVCLSADIFGNMERDGRLGVVLIEFQTPTGVYATYALENACISMDQNTKGVQYSGKGELEFITAYFGTSVNYRDCLQKILHYNYFRWNEIYVDSETFPSLPSADEIEYLTLIYINENGIHAVSAAEKETLVYSAEKAELFLKDTSSCILPDIGVLEFEHGMDCTWAGSLYAALNYMGENYTYEQIMGISGACYRIAFCDVWDWSATDALVAYDYASILFQAIGFEPICANRLEKNERANERERIVTDILQNKPVLAINLRIAPEWGVITGYAEGGKTFYVRTYFDQDYLNDKEEYLESDSWPFLILHFGQKREKLSLILSLRASLQAMVDSFEASCERGYYQGEQAYEQWITGLNKEELWNSCSSQKDVERRLEVNDALLLNLIDARRCAGIYLAESIPLLQGEEAELLIEIAQGYSSISETLSLFREELKHSNGQSLCYNMTIQTKLNTSLRIKQISFLQEIKIEEKKLVEKAKLILELLRIEDVE